MHFSLSEYQVKMEKDESGAQILDFKGSKPPDNLQDFYKRHVKSFLSYQWSIYTSICISYHFGDLDH